VSHVFIDRHVLGFEKNGKSLARGIVEREAELLIPDRSKGFLFGGSLETGARAKNAVNGIGVGFAKGVHLGQATGSMTQTFSRIARLNGDRLGLVTDHSVIKNTHKIL
jgi:hypothetical protein